MKIPAEVHWLILPSGELRHRANAAMMKNAIVKQLSSNSLPTTPVHNRMNQSSQVINPVVSPGVVQPIRAVTPRPVNSNGLPSPLPGIYTDAHFCSEVETVVFVLGATLYSHNFYVQFVLRFCWNEDYKVSSYFSFRNGISGGKFAQVPHTSKGKIDFW